MEDNPRLVHAQDAVEVLHEYTSHKANFVWDDFPRDIERLIGFGLELPIISLPVLTIQSAAEYLCLLHSDSVPHEASQNRTLYGLLHVGPPFNAIFIRDDLPLQIRHYVLAHELGHFVTDVLSIQQSWHKALTEQEAAVRQAFMWQGFNPHLELTALVKGLPSRPMTITGRGAMLVEEATEREILADLFARELQAPWESVSLLFEQEPRQAFVSALHDQYNLPRQIASSYYEDLRLALTPVPPFLDRLFAPLLP